MKEEIWKDIPEYEGVYMVSDLGNIKSLNYGRMGKTSLRKTAVSRCGYERLNLSKDGEKKRLPVHRLVMLAFVGDLPEGMEVNHKNGIKTDNRIENLEYVSKSDNMKHAYKLKLINRTTGENNGQSKLTKSDIPVIRDLIDSGNSHTSISKKYDVSQQCISKIASGKSWSHV